MLSQQVFRRGDSPPLTREPGTQRLPETDSFFWKDLSQDSFVSTLKLCDTIFLILKNIQYSFFVVERIFLFLWRTLVAVSERHLEAAVCLTNSSNKTKVHSHLIVGRHQSKKNIYIAQLTYHPPTPLHFGQFGPIFLDVKNRKSTFSRNIFSYYLDKVLFHRNLGQRLQSKL